MIFLFKLTSVIFTISLLVVNKGEWGTYVVLVGDKTQAQKFGVEINIERKDAEWPPVGVTFKGKIYSILEEKDEARRGVLLVPNCQAEMMQERDSDGNLGMRVQFVIFEREESGAWDRIDQPWKCDKCTFMNTSREYRNTCEMCYSERAYLSEDHNPLGNKVQFVGKYKRTKFEYYKEFLDKIGANSKTKEAATVSMLFQEVTDLGGGKWRVISDSRMIVGGINTSSTSSMPTRHQYEFNEFNDFNSS